MMWNIYSEKEIRKEEARMQLLRNVFLVNGGKSVLHIPEKVTRRLPAMPIIGPQLNIPPI